MTDYPITMRRPRAFPKRRSLHWYSASAPAATGVKAQWTIPFHGRIVDVVIDAETAGSGAGTSDIYDVHKNGTTIYTTQANRPTLTKADTGMFTEAGEPEITDVKPGDVLLLELDSKCGTSAARVKALIVIEMP